MVRQMTLRSLAIFALFVFVTILLLFQTSAEAQSIPSTLGWYQIPNTKLRAVCAVTQGFTSIAATEGCDAITMDWNSGVFDTANNRLIIWGGGHNGYYGNEVYALNMNTLTMQRLNNPSVPFNLCQPSNPDGTPVSRHTHDQIVYVAHLGTMYNKGGSLACASGGISQDAWSLNLNALQWTQKTAQPSISGNTFAMDYEPNTRLVWVQDDNFHLYAYNPDTDTWTLKVSNFGGGSNYRRTGIIDPVRRLFFQIGNNTVHVWDISKATPTHSAWTTTGPQNMVGANGPGLAYDPTTQEIVALAWRQYRLQAQPRHAGVDVDSLFGRANDSCDERHL